MKKTRNGKYVPGGYTLKVKRSSSGLGLYTYTDIPRGKCVIEYKGRALTRKEETTSRSKYLFEVSKRKTIDGAARSNTARYINHSCLPNCEIAFSRGKVFIMSKKNIQLGEELTYDYQKEYFNAYIKPKGCRCSKCTGKKAR